MPTTISGIQKEKHIQTWANTLSPSILRDDHNVIESEELIDENVTDEMKIKIFDYLKEILIADNDTVIMDNAISVDPKEKSVLNNNDVLSKLNFTDIEINMIDFGNQTFAIGFEKIEPIDCSNFVPGTLMKILNNTRMTVRDANHKQLINQLRLLLNTSYYSKSLRPFLHDCLRKATANINRAHPPLTNPFAPLILKLEIGLNKLVELSFDGTIKVKITLAVGWTDHNWRWKINTRWEVILLLRYTYHQCLPSQNQSSIL